MKASIFIATYNKRECLSNTLYSISQQVTTFPFEVCVIDDCSVDNPEALVKEFLPDAKFKRLAKHVGLPWTQSYCCELMSPDTTVVVIQSADVMYLGTDVLQKLCDTVRPGWFSMATVKNIQVDPNLHKTSGWIDSGDIPGWDIVKGMDIYSGQDRPGGDWLLFLGALTKEDMYKIDFDYRCCDVVLQQRMKEEGLNPVFLSETKAIHQKHPPAHLWPCSIMDKCEYWCRRKG